MKIDLREMFNYDALLPTLQAIRDPKLVKPDYIWEDISGLNDEIRSEFKLIVFDLDRTLVNEGQVSLHAKIRETFYNLLSTRTKIAARTNKAASRNQSFNTQYNVPVYDQLPKKPHPQVLQQILAEHELADHPEQALFVGDSLLTDILGAKRVGMKTALVNYRGLSERREDLLTKRWIGRPLENWLLRRLGIKFPK